MQSELCCCTVSNEKENDSVHWMIFNIVEKAAPQTTNIDTQGILKKMHTQQYCLRTVQNMEHFPVQLLFEQNIYMFELFQAHMF